MSAPASSFSYPPGAHLLIDFFEAQNLCDAAYIEQALRRAAARCGAQILGIKLHHFGNKGGVSGMALLAESHISIHTWPETGFAALDIFMCGNCDAERAIAPLVDMFAPAKSHITRVIRGSA